MSSLLGKLICMNGVPLRRYGRALLIACACALFGAIFAVDPRLAILFSPLFTLLVLLNVDPRLTESIVDFVHRLGGDAQRTLKRPLGKTPGTGFGPVSRPRLSPLGSRAPPRFSY